MTPTCAKPPSDLHTVHRTVAGDAVADAHRAPCGRPGSWERCHRLRSGEDAGFFSDRVRTLMNAERPSCRCQQHADGGPFPTVL